MDRHEVPGATAEETASNHAADLEHAAEFGVEFFSYWHDSARGLVFCFARAPEMEAVTRAHRVSHGQIPAEIIEVSESDVVRFLGRVHDPVDASEATSAFRTVVFTDLVGSTELLDRVGESEYMVRLTEHNLILRNALLSWEGREVKHTGDGLMIVFEPVGKALGWALEVREVFREHPDLSVRFGMAAGEPVDQYEDIFGAVVTAASRICSLAGPDRIYVSGLVRELGTTEGFEFDRGKSLVLKGFSKPTMVYELLGRL